MRYAVIDDSGRVTAFYEEGDELPLGAFAITNEQWETWIVNTHGLKWSNGSLVTYVSSAEEEAIEEQSSIRRDLADSDREMIRVIDDIMAILIAKGIVSLTDFPQAVVDRYQQRTTLREKVV